MYSSCRGSSHHKRHSKKPLTQRARHDQVVLLVERRRSPSNVQPIRNRLHTAGLKSCIPGQRTVSLQFAMYDGTDSSGEQSCSLVKAGFVFVILVLDSGSGDEEGIGMRKPQRSTPCI